MVVLPPVLPPTHPPTHHTHTHLAGPLQQAANLLPYLQRALVRLRLQAFRIQSLDLLKDKQQCMREEGDRSTHWDVWGESRPALNCSTRLQTATAP